MLSQLIRYLLRHPFVRFCMVGAAGYVVDASVLAFDTGPLGMSFTYGRVFSILAAMLCTWMGNRYLTFAERRARTLSGAVEEALKFIGTNAVGAAVNYSVSLALVAFAGAPFHNKFVAQACGVLVGLLFNFTLSRQLVFKNRA